MKTIILFATLLLLHIQFSNAQSWQQKSSELSDLRGIIEIAAPDSRNAYAMGYNADGSWDEFHQLTITHDGGDTWQAQAVPGMENHLITAIGAASANKIFALAWNYSGDGNAGGKLMRSTNGGKTWSQVGTNTFTDPGSFPDDILFFNSNDGVMLGDPVNGYFEIYTTNNGGWSWKKVPAANIPTPLTPYELGATYLMEVYGNTVWAVTFVLDEDFVPNGEGRLLQSDDKGKTWYVRNAAMPLEGFDGTLKFRNNNVGLFKNNGVLYRTTDGGTTWNEVNYTGTWFSFDIDNVPGKPGWWVSTGGDLNFPTNSVYGFGSSISYDDGDSWTVIDTMEHTCVEMTSDRHGYTGGITRGSGNDGVFVFAPSCSYAPMQVSSFTLVNAASNADNGALNYGDVVDLAQGTVNVRADLCAGSGVGSMRFRLNGREYRIENDAPYAIAGDSPKGNYNEWHVYPGTYVITAIPYSGSNGSGTAGVSRSIRVTFINSGAAKNDVAENMNPTIEGSEMMMSAFPNPFNDQLTFEFSVPGDAQVTIELYNLSGERMATVFEGKVIGGEINRQVFHAGDLAGGVYLYRMKTNDSVVMERVMLAR